MADTRTISKTLSFWLRHKPEKGGLTLDASGWTPAIDVLAALGREGLPDDLATLQGVIAGSDKKRFELSDDGAMIRARQGHSVTVELDWPVTEPPETLFHGTVDRFLTAIMAEGLKPMKRHHVHLSPDRETASFVGARRGEPMILEIAAGRMHRDGHLFRLTTNNVRLADAVPPAYLTAPSRG